MRTPKGNDDENDDYQRLPSTANLGWAYEHYRKQRGNKGGSRTYSVHPNPRRERRKRTIDVGVTPNSPGETGQHRGAQQICSQPHCGEQASPER